MLLTVPFFFLPNLQINNELAILKASTLSSEDQTTTMQVELSQLRAKVIDSAGCQSN